MKPLARQILLILTLALVTLGSNVPAYCPQLTAIVGYLSKDACATSFCSSYLRIPVSTTVTTSTTCTVSTVYTTLATSTSTVTEVPKTDTAGFTITSTCTLPTVQNKRAVAACTTPSCLKNSPIAAISSACACFNIPTSTTTIKTIITTTSVTTIVVTPTATAMTTITITPTVTPTQYALPPFGTMDNAPAYESGPNSEGLWEGLYDSWAWISSAGHDGKVIQSGQIGENGVKISWQRDCLDLCEYHRRNFATSTNLFDCVAVAYSYDDAGVITCHLKSAIATPCDLYADKSSTYDVRKYYTIPVQYH